LTSGCIQTVSIFASFANIVANVGGIMMDKHCRVVVRFGYYDEKTEGIYHTSEHTFEFNDYKACGKVIDLLKSVKGVEYDYKHYIEDFRK
jgi:hypothetical protein